VANRVSTTLVSATLVPAIHILQASLAGGVDGGGVCEKGNFGCIFYFIIYSSIELRNCYVCHNLDIDISGTWT
jgi:hypothetical protein